MSNDKKNILVYLCIALFGIVGVYLTFFAGNTDKYDSQVKAYRIYPNESSDSDSVTYQPIYYFRVNGTEYECRAKTGSSSYPSDDKNTVYYDSSDPTNCKTEYEKSTSKVAGIICLIATAVMVYFFIIYKPSNNTSDYNQSYDGQNQLDSEQAEKILGIVNKVQLIYKRVILGIFIVILLVLTLIDTAIFSQTLKARNYVEIVATYVDKKETSESEVFDDYVYVFTDKNGNQHEIIESYAQEEISIKYNENNPEDYYTESALLDKSGMIWYIVKVVALILLVFLFSNKKLLSKISVSASSN